MSSTGSSSLLKSSSSFSVKILALQLGQSVFSALLRIRISTIRGQILIFIVEENKFCSGISTFLWEFTYCTYGRKREKNTDLAK